MTANSEGQTLLEACTTPPLHFQRTTRTSPSCRNTATSHPNLDAPSHTTTTTTFSNLPPSPPFCQHLSTFISPNYSNCLPSGTQMDTTLWINSYSQHICNTIPLNIAGLETVLLNQTADDLIKYNRIPRRFGRLLCLQLHYRCSPCR